MNLKINHPEEMSPLDKWWADLEIERLGIDGDVVVANQACIIPGVYFEDRLATLRVMDFKIVSTETYATPDGSGTFDMLEVEGREAPITMHPYCSGGFHLQSILS